MLTRTLLLIAIASPVSGQSNSGPYEVRLEPSVLVKMSDGVRLSTDLYFPVDAPEPLPVIQIRLPYNKNVYTGFRRPGSEAQFFASHGFVVAVQDMRGRFESEGEFYVGRPERRDGYEFTEWLATQPWSNGLVGSYGCSYLGENQIQLAAERHPAHRAAIPQAAGGAYAGTYRPFAFMDGGAVELASTLGWFVLAGQTEFNRPSADTPDSTYRRLVQSMNTSPPPPRVNISSALRELPIVDILNSRGIGPTEYEEFLSNPPGTAYWDSLNYITDDDRFDVPALHVTSWYDGAPNETLELFNLMRVNAVTELGRDNQFAIVAPTAHCLYERATQSTVVGQLSMGDARLNYRQIYLDWFEHWLKGVDNGVTEMPHLQYFLMGANEWRSAETWPVEGTDFVRMYFHSGGDANSRNGDGGLSPFPPDDQPADGFEYDPMNPVPSVGGPICCVSAQAAPPGAFDQSTVELREDILVYTSPPLEEDLEVTGPLSAVLYVSSSARDTDFTVKLVDVHPDGRAYNVQESILRARYRDGYERP